MKRQLVNFALFQLGWFVCLQGGDAYAIGFTLVALVIHGAWVMRESLEWLTIAAVTVAGVTWDWLLGAGHVLLWPSDISPLPIPLWLICLWVLFATTLHHSLAWLQGKRWLASVLGAFAGPAAYFAGSHLTEVSINPPLMFSLLIIGIGWALILPLGISLATALSEPGAWIKLGRS